MASITIANSDCFADLFQTLMSKISEISRLRKLNNRELVSEVKKTTSADDLLIQEMMTRLWPDWDEEYYEQGE